MWCHKKIQQKNKCIYVKYYKKNMLLHTYPSPGNSPEKLSSFVIKLLFSKKKVIGFFSIFQLLIFITLTTAHRHKSKRRYLENNWCQLYLTIHLTSRLLVHGIWLFLRTTQIIWLYSNHFSPYDKTVSLFFQLFRFMAFFKFIKREL